MATGKVQMNPQEAQAWLNQLEVLNDQLDTECQGTYQSMQTVQEASSGSVVDQICSGITEMINAEKDLVNAFTGLVDAVSGVISAGAEAVETISGLISKVLPFMGL